MQNNEPDPSALPLIKIVGISAGGKSTLVKALRQHGYQARPISQEHSNMADLWQHFDDPQVLIYLDVDLETQRTRRPDVQWDRGWLVEETARLRHARDHADLTINTSGLSAEAVLQIALTFLQNEKVRHTPTPLPPLTATGSARQTTRPLDDAAADVASSDVSEPPPSDSKLRSNRTQRRLDKRQEKRKEKGQGTAGNQESR